MMPVSGQTGPDARALDPTPFLEKGGGHWQGQTVDWHNGDAATPPSPVVLDEHGPITTLLDADLLQQPNAIPAQRSQTSVQDDPT